MRALLFLGLVTPLAVVAASALVPAVEAPRPPPPEPAAHVSSTKHHGIAFTDVAAQSREFAGYYHSISLTPEQDAIKSEVLGSMPAPCCSGSSALTCCCPCNLSKTIWGLSNVALAKHGADADALRGIVTDWIEFTNPGGKGRGTGCYRGSCGASFDHGGCGGMNETALLSR